MNKISKAANFASYIRHARERKGMSLSQAAKAIGCTKSHLWDLEQSRSDNPTIKTLTGIAQALNERLSYLAELAAISRC
jgi:transcriptional regulator with XRE-family HTH domain